LDCKSIKAQGRNRTKAMLQPCATRQAVLDAWSKEGMFKFTTKRQIEFGQADIS